MAQTTKRLVVGLSLFAIAGATANVIVIHTFGFHFWLLLIAAAVVASLVVVIVLLVSGWSK